MSDRERLSSVPRIGKELVHLMYCSVSERNCGYGVASLEKNEVLLAAFVVPFPDQVVGMLATPVEGAAMQLLAR